MYVYAEEPMKILVMSSNRPTSIALAALIAAAIKYKAGYEDTVTRVVKASSVQELAANVPQLTTYGFNDNQVYIHVDADWEESLYEPALPNCPPHTQSCSIAGNRLLDFGRTPIPDALAYAVSTKNIDAKCSLFDFHDMITAEHRCIPVYVVSEVYSENLNIDSKLESITHELTFCKNKRIERNELTLKIQAKDSSFIFIDYDDPGYIDLKKNKNIIRILPELFPQTKKFAYRVADIFLIHKFAPKISDILNTTMPQQQHLHEILHLYNSTKDIDEAACAWCNKNLDKFNSWTNTADRNIYFRLVICDGELAVKYEAIVNNILRKHSFFKENITLFTYNLYPYFIDCTTPNAISDFIVKSARTSDGVELGGIIVPAVQAIAVSKAALENKIPHLIFYDVPPAGTTLKKITSTVSGEISLLIRSYLNYFKKHDWQRLAVISEDSAVAKSITKELEPHILLKEKIVHEKNLNNMEKIVTEVITSLRNENARVFFLNVGYETANIIACAAAKLEMKDETQFVWIAREWYPTSEMCGKDVKITTVSYWWQGGSETSIKNLGGNAEIRKAIDQEVNGPWPVLAAPMVDAFMMMTFKTQAVLSKHPEFTYALRHPKCLGHLSEIKSVPIPGVVENIMLNNFTQSNPLIYIYEWRNYKNKLIGLWRANSDDSEIISIFENFYDDVVDDKRSYCTTTYSGEKFNPVCHTPIYACSPVVFVILVLSFLWLRRKRLIKSKKRERELLMRLLSRCERTAEVLKDYLVDRSWLELFEELGHGHFGRVRFGMLRVRNRIPTPVAAKTLRDDAAPAEEAEFLREGSAMASLSHDNIVKLIGVCADAQGPPLLLMEHAFFGDLLKYLRERRHFAEMFGRDLRFPNDAGDLVPFKMPDDPQSLDPEARHVTPLALTRLAQEAADAVDYLSSKHFLHRDIRAANCLIDVRRTLKLADFGMARKVDAKESLPDEPEESEDYKYICRRRGIFPVPWMAPESLDRGEFSHETDVWALGVLILEIATLGARPYGTWQPIQILRYVQNGGRPQLPIDVSYHTCEVTEMCWTEDPKQRATAKEIRTYLTDNPRAIRAALRPAWPELDHPCTPDGTDSGFGERLPEDWPKGVDLRVSTL
ncbi:hypothetical protein O0L34_g1577 [Tuta absoluta]|nr:hypothetical protein O0L34_g1577 [Tuta absoluta]